MMIAFLVVTIILISAIAWTSWAMHCNNKTYKQRICLLHLEIEKGNQQKTIDMYNTVTYDQHMHCLIKMKNPYKLYKLKTPVDN
jgi:hypothetical protein